MVKKLQALKAKKGFTLVELIVVIAIIGVLAAILVPVMMGQVTKAKINSLDSTASTVVTTVNTWIADRYTHGQSGGLTSGTKGVCKAFTATGGVVTGAAEKDDTNITWDALDGADDETSLTHALKDAYNFASDDVIKFWIDDTGKCVAAVFVQGGKVADLTNVKYKEAAGKEWEGIYVTNEKDGIVNLNVKGNGDGAMVGANPKLKTNPKT